MACPSASSLVSSAGTSPLVVPPRSRRRLDRRQEPLRGLPQAGQGRLMLGPDDAPRPPTAGDVSELGLVPVMRLRCVEEGPLCRGGRLAPPSRVKAALLQGDLVEPMPARMPVRSCWARPEPSREFAAALPERSVLLDIEEQLQLGGADVHLLVALGLVGLALLVSAMLWPCSDHAQHVRASAGEASWTLRWQAAIWDRLLRLPAPFFRRYTAGDLADRVLGINTIRQILAGAVVSSVLAGVFSILNLALLFYYAPGLAWSAIGLVLASVLVTVLLGLPQMRYQRALVEIGGKISGLVLQMVSGMPNCAWREWKAALSRVGPRRSAVKGRRRFKARTLSNGLATFNSAYPVLTSLVLFALIGLGQGQAGALYPTLSTGAFLAFSAAFTQLLFASLSVSSALTAALSVVPLYESVKPVLETLPEVSPAQADPGTLTGEIEISHVAFQYRGVVSNGDEPLVLKDVSLHIKPGEFVAVVGPSGCGKSTLLRLLLKFETPLSGAIFYDGQDLDQLDVEAVRRQAGVVLQDGKLMSGSVLSNIVGSSLLTIDDAWEAARMVGLAQDIEQMPMGMHTVVSEGGGTCRAGNGNGC